MSAHCHAVAPNGDGDKCLCRVRLSQKRGRTAANRPGDISCDACTDRVIALWRHNGVDISTLGDALMTTWPWNHKEIR